jgi:hypothetical protein
VDDKDLKKVFLDYSDEAVNKWSASQAATPKFQLISGS